MTMHLTVEGVTQPITGWALDYGVPCSLIRERLRRGWSEERAVTEPMVVRREEKLPADAMVDKPRAPRPIVPSPYIPASHAPRFVVASKRRKRRPARQQASAHSGALEPGCSQRSTIIRHNGLELTAAQWAERLGVQKQLIHWRIRKGWLLDDVLNGRVAALGPLAWKRKPQPSKPQ